MIAPTYLRGICSRSRKSLKGEGRLSQIDQTHRARDKSFNGFTPESRPRDSLLERKPRDDDDAAGRAKSAIKGRPTPASPQISRADAGAVSLHSIRLAGDFERPPS